MKKNKRKKLKKTLQPNAPLSVKEAEKKIKSIRAKLQDLKEYKAILTEDGLKPDEEDKRRESELIIRLLRLEKTAGITIEKEVPWRGKPGTGKPGTDKPGGPRDSKSKDRDRRPSKDGPTHFKKKFRDNDRLASRKDGPTRPEKKFRDDDRPAYRKDGPARPERKFRDDDRPAYRKDGPARPERKFRDDDRPASREAKPEGNRSNRDNKKTINRGSKPTGAKKPDDRKGPKGPKRPNDEKKAGEKPARRPFVKKSKVKK